MSYGGGRASALTDAFWGYLKSLSPVHDETMRVNDAAPPPVKRKSEKAPMRLVSSWSKNLRDPQAREDFNNLVLGSQLVLDRLSEIIEEKLRAREVFKEEDYKDSSWAHKCADRNGYSRALREVVTILKGVDHDTTSN